MRRFVILFIAFGLLLAAHNGLAATVAPSASTTDNLNGVAMVGSSDGWAVGNEGTIQHYDGSSWNLIASGTTSDLYGVSFGPPASPNPNAGFAVGGSGGIAMALYWSGVSWFPIVNGLSGPAAQKLSSVFELNPTEA